ncbi:MAG: UbiA family prenyltransferase [Candidatus Aenigmarchaeota archaeon]|nr:UbiA family prenyltransferase [Candidatus Aenigmarchaeota archaeon]
MSILSYLKITRPFNGVMSMIAVYIAALVAGVVSLSNLVPSLQLVFAMLATFFISSFGMVFNDIFDIEIDKINKPKRPLPSGKISLKVANIYGVLLAIVGLAFAYFVNFYAFGVAIVATVLLYAYAAKLKKVMLVGNIVVSFLVGLTFIYGGVINFNFLGVIMLAFLAFLANMAREIYKTCEDVVGDKKEGVRSLAIKYGVVRAKMAGSVFIILAVILSIVPFIIRLFGLPYLIVVTVADLVFLMAVFSDINTSAKMVKLGMNLALLAFLLGALIVI